MVLLMVSAGAALATTEEATDDSGVVEVSGVVQVVEADEEGAPLVVKVGSHVISNYERGPELLDLVEKKVTLSGTIYVEEDGKTTLDVASYTVDE